MSSETRFRFFLRRHTKREIVHAIIELEKRGYECEYPIAFAEQTKRNLEKVTTKKSYSKKRYHEYETGYYYTHMIEKSP